MTSARVEQIYTLLGQGAVATDDYRPLHGELVQLVSRGQPGEYVFPYTDAQGHSRHDFNVGGITFSMVEQDDGSWLRVNS